MIPGNLTQRHAGLRTIAIVLMLTPLACVIGCQTPTAPPPPPSGGNTLRLDYAEFAQSVEPILIQHRCDAGSAGDGGDCHGSGIRGTLWLSPESAPDTLFDFNQVIQQVSIANRDSSHILTKPLAISAGGVPHSFKAFATTDDPGYQAIHTWIQHGVIQ